LLLLAAANFQYDAFGRRVSKEIGNASTSYLYDGMNPVQELSGTAVTANTLTGLGVDEYFQRTSASGTSDYLADALGSTVALTNSAGALQTQYTYEPFGNTTSSGPASANPYQFTARENDATSLYFYRARYYDPAIARFTTEDPVGFRGGANLYLYVYDQPTALLDPSGLQAGSAPGAPPHYGWFWTTLNRWFNWLMSSGQPNPNMKPINPCDVGDMRLFYEAGPNPYAENGKYEPDWVAFQSQFGQKCDAAKKPGKDTYKVCRSGASAGGVFAYCTCCERCQAKPN
jgi:RHS repeat-associated protein